MKVTLLCIKVIFAAIAIGCIVFGAAYMPHSLESGLVIIGGVWVAGGIILSFINNNER